MEVYAEAWYLPLRLSKSPSCCLCHELLSFLLGSCQMFEAHALPPVPAAGPMLHCMYKALHVLRGMAQVLRRLMCSRATGLAWRALGCLGCVVDDSLVAIVAVKGYRPCSTPSFGHDASLMREPSQRPRQPGTLHWVCLSTIHHHSSTTRLCGRDNCVG